MTASDDLSRYFDAGWPSVQGEDEPAVAYTGAIESIQPVESAPVVEGADAAAAPTIETVDDADLTMADDLSPYLDASALPVDDRDAEELPVSAEVDAIDLNTSLSFDSGSGDDSVIDDAAALPLDSELSSLQDEMAVPGFAEPVTLAAALEAGLHVIEQERTLDDDGQWPVIGLQASELAPGEADAFAEDADVGGEAAVGEGESADQPSPATVIEAFSAEARVGSGAPVRFFEMEEAPGQGTINTGAGAEIAAADIEPLRRMLSRRLLRRMPKTVPMPMRLTSACTTASWSTSLSRKAGTCSTTVMA